MPQPDAPLKRSIGLSGILRWLLAVLVVVALGAAVSAHRYALAIAGLLFVIVAVAFLWRGSRARRAARTPLANDDPGKGAV
jgi:membrane protein implicated in regulation of membrane protease activity